jgi:hypothetical protein
MIQIVLGVATLLLACASWYFHGQAKQGAGDLFASLSAACFAAFLAYLQYTAPPGPIAVILPWVVLAVGLISLVVSIVVYTSHRRLLSGLRELGVTQVWRNRAAGFVENGRDYLSFCRSVIRSANPGTTIRLMSTAGDGVAVMHGEFDPVFKEPLQKGCRFQIILVNPVSDRVAKKQEAEDSSGRYGPSRKEGAVAQKIRDKLRYLEQWRNQAMGDPQIRAMPQAIQVRCIDDIPVVNLVDNGSQAVIALQVINRKGGDSPAFLLDKEGVLYNYLQDHFDFLFEELSIAGEEVAKRFDKELAPKIGEVSKADREA